MTVLLIVIAVVGVLVCLGCIVGIASPATLLGVVRSVLNKPGLGWPVIGVRFPIGIVLILAAPASLFPFMFRVIGVLAILETLVLAWLGRARIIKVVAWFAGGPANAVRALLIFGFGLGAFLVYGTGLV
ncbi:MAG: hypothetical protein KJO76_03350 [Gammaproteobacteria bacterium]|nr:hypothetical protein [Gammaproteobacteria bacterium]NND35892.1 hypothetical protein [Gammaproteobacteria bacterium]